MIEVEKGEMSRRGWSVGSFQVHEWCRRGTEKSIVVLGRNSCFVRSTQKGNSSNVHYLELLTILFSI
jgi:hypothetical protein